MSCMNRGRLSLFAATALFVACGGAGEEAANGAQDDAADAPPPTMTASAAGLDGCYLHREGTLEEAAQRTSPLSKLGVAFDGGTGWLCYGAPSANDRTVIGGEVVPFDEMWRVGANEPTTLHLSAPASIGGVALEPGSYSIYALPGAEEWQIFVNSNHERWGIPITDEVRGTEVGSFTVTPEATNQMVEQLSFSYAPNGENTMGDIIMEWENTRITFHLHPGTM